MAAMVSSTTGPSILPPPCVPGPSGLHAEASSSSPEVQSQDLHAVTSSAIAAAGGGESTNGSSDTPRRPRKRPRRPENWRKNVAKAKRAKGEAYVSPTSGKLVPARKTGPACKCKRKCYEFFSDAERDDLLKRFYGLANKEVQDAYLFGLISSKFIKRKRPRTSTGITRRASYCYHIRFPGRDFVVCLSAFAGLHGITAARVRRLAISSSESFCPPTDRRGKHTKHKKIPESIRKNIDEHIRSFPVMKSHYSRGRHSKRRVYLSPLLSVAEMHNLYIQKYENSAEKPTVTYSYYLKYFNENFNMTFGYPKTDTCGTCDALNTQIGSAQDTQKVSLQAQKEDHLRRAENFYSSLRTNTQLAKLNSHIATVTFDFQQNLPLPHIPVGEVFYLHQLWMYVFGVHECGANQAVMYCWPEFIAAKGSSEVISCLDNFLSSLPEEVTTVYLYSDGCPGQNKNVTVMQYLFTLIRIGRFKLIQHHFPVRGHSFLPNDRDFGRTETKKRRNERIYTPEQWYEVIKSARRRKPFTVTPVSQGIVKDYVTHLAPFFKKSVRSGKQPLGIQKARVLEYADTHPSQVWVKYGGEDEQWVKFELEKKGAAPTLPSEPKYTNPLPLKPTKVADVRKLVNKYVPTQYRSFYDAMYGDDEVSSETDESEYND